MKLTYIYDLCFQFDETYYYSKNFSDQTWQKYFDIAEEVHVYPFISTIQKSEMSPIKSPLTIHSLPFRSKAEIYADVTKMWNTAMDIVSTSEQLVIRLPSHLGLFVGLACLHQQKPYRVEVVGNALEAYGLHGRKLYKLAAPCLHLIMKKIVKKAAVAIYVTDDYLQACYPNSAKQYAVPNAVIKEYSIEVEWKKEPFTIGMIGSLETAYKGHDTLFHALKKLDQLNRPVVVRLLGEGVLKDIPYYQNITVHHDGLIDHDALVHWYQSLQLYVQPSYTEAIGRSIMEAMSFGLPVVASRVGGIPELIEQQALFRARDDDQMARKIAAFMYDPQLWARTSRRNHQYIQRFEHNNVQRQRKKAFQC